MRFSTLLLPFIAATHALPLVPREAPDLAPQLLQQIKELNTATTELTAAVNSFDGSLLGVLPQGLGVITASKKVDNLVLKATHTAQESSSFTQPESQEILGTLGSQIGPIQESLNAINAKYPQFKRTLTAPLVLYNLKTLKEHTGGLTTAVKEKVTPDIAGFLDLGRDILNQAFDDAIAVYSQ